MSAGLNGTQTGNAAAEYLKSVRQSLPDTLIFVIEHCCSPVNANRYSQFITMNQIVKDFCATDDNIWFIETMGVIDYTDLSFYKDDQMHLNAKGYTALTSVLKPVIQSVLAGEPVPLILPQIRGAPAITVRTAQQRTERRAKYQQQRPENGETLSTVWPLDHRVLLRFGGLRGRRGGEGPEPPERQRQRITPCKAYRCASCWPAGPAK